MSQLPALGGQSPGASASASVLSMSIQGLFPLGLTILISLLSKGLSRIYSSTTGPEGLHISKSLEIRDWCDSGAGNNTKGNGWGVRHFSSRVSRSQPYLANPESQV